MTKPLEVTITIDTKFIIGGAFDDPRKKAVGNRAALCEVDGKGQGVDFLLETFNKYDTRASFFVECVNYFYFGDEPMQSIVRKIQSAGQDTQLHIHPCWLNFNQNPEIGRFDTNDACSGRSYEELKKIFELSIEVFERWTGKRPEAIRTGNLMVDLNVYKVMSDLNIPLASNVGLEIFKPKEGELQLFSGRSKIDDVMEVPVFTYADKDIMGRMPAKSLQIASCSWPEMRYLLKKARKNGIENIVIHTHPFEFIKRRDEQYLEITRNRVNQERLENLCAFIKEHDQDFTTVDFGSQVDVWKNTPQKNINNFRIPPRYRLGRMANNFINAMIWNY
ncbi:MAG: polysaccharide deacetylase [Kordiimonadaceae bacterium]|nr:polysaccharide deacetylase [Kordiimonadaceae bacterium]MBT6031869.1 polysaccharide deacetylase [Kordiimonadaceae bacterium]